MQNSRLPCVEYASITWDSIGYPTSEAFEDVYYSTINGLEESKYVFLEANHLPERWSALTPDDNYTFVIAETGFGTGLNFLNAWKLWDEYANNHNCRLHFISTEKFPIKPDDMAKAHKLWPTLADYSNKLVSQSPLPLQGNHRIHFSERVDLTLIYDDVISALETNIFKAHCWFLDGFAPSKNPDMWNDKLYSLLAKRSFHQATLSTFTAVGAIRRSLAAQGFEMKKVKGFGTKRDMLTGIYCEPSGNQLTTRLFHRFDKSKPWLRSNHPPHERRSYNPSVTIVGAGLAGCWTAHHLAKRGAKVTLLEKGPAPGHAASGNPIGALYVKPGIEYSNETQLALLATEYAKQCLDQLQNDSLSPLIWQNCGVLQLIQSIADRDYADRLMSHNNYPDSIISRLDSQAVNEKAGALINQEALYFNMCGKAFPKRLCQRLIQHENITTYFDTELSKVDYNDVNNRWSIVTNNARKTYFETEVLVLATANDTAAFEPTKHLPIKPIKGQITIAQTGHDSGRLNTVLCGEGYAAQDEELGLCFGASFKLGKNSNLCTTEEQTSNLIKLEKLSSQLRGQVDELSEDFITNRSSTRTASPDYQPIVGPVADIEQLKMDFAKLRKDAKAKFSNNGSYFPNLYVNTGHGSKGLTTTPIAAELLCDYIYGTPFALNSTLVEALHPTRFTIRAMIRNKE